MGENDCLIQAEFKAISLAAIILHLEKDEYFEDKKTFEKWREHIENGTNPYCV